MCVLVCVCLPYFLQVICHNNLCTSDPICLGLFPFWLFNAVLRLFMPFYAPLRHFTLLYATVRYITVFRYTGALRYKVLVMAVFSRTGISRVFIIPLGVNIKPKVEVNQQESRFNSFRVSNVMFCGL